MKRLKFSSSKPQSQLKSKTLNHVRRNSLHP